MNNSNFNTFSEFLGFKNNLKLSSELIFSQYLSKIYLNLIQREDNYNYNPVKNIKTLRNSFESHKKDMTLSSLKKASKKDLSSLKLKLNDNGISLKTFLEFIDIQEFIGERIFKYLNKSNTNTNANVKKLNKNDFCKGLKELYYGDYKNLIKFTFSLADFNNDQNIYKSDMKLLMAYIPASTEFSQKLKIKQINNIINIFFEEKIEKSEDNEEKELNYETYLKYVEEYIQNDKYNNNNKMNNFELFNNYSDNAPFFYFISILSYLFKNLPFNIENVNYFIYSKTKMKLKCYRNENSSLTQRNYCSSSKKLNSFYDNEKISNKGDLNLRMHSNTKNKYIIDAALSKIDKKDLFKTRKSSSQNNLKNESMFISLKSNRIQKPKNMIHEYIISKNENKNINLFSYKNSLYQNNIYQNKSSFKSKKNLSQIVNNNHDHSKDFSPLTKGIKKSTPFLNKIIWSPESQNKYKKNSSKETNESSSNSSSNNVLINLTKKLSSISGTKEKKLNIPLSVGKKEKDENNDLDSPEEFCLYEQCEDEDSLKINKNNSKEEEGDNFDSNEVFAFKIVEDGNNIYKKVLDKYYVVFSEKELLFFNSENKNELYDLWYIYKSYISINKENINNINYYTIIFTFNNNYVKKLYFLNEKICSNLAKKIKNTIKNLDFDENYDLLEQLGHGHFGEVYKCKNKLTGQIYAVKIINKLNLKPKNFELIRHEKNYLKLLKHQNIIYLKDIYENKKNIYLITEYCEGGDLLSFLINKQRENAKISEKVAAKIIRKIAEGIKYLNFFGIIHRDIKPENIMFTQKDNIKSLKIIDLGVCQTLSYGELATDSIGTNGYISPEIYKHHGYSFKIDIWSLGVLLYLIITGEILPFDDDNMDSHIIGKKVIYTQQAYPEKYFGNKSKGLINLLDKMLEKDDRKRISINELLKNRWFENIKNENIIV